MKTWLTNLWDDLRSGFWFLPAVIIAAAVVLALALLAVDARIDRAAPLPDWLTSSPPAARTTLSALAGALLTGTSVVFSITMLVLSQTASQYGSRLLRTVADGNGAQITFGLFLGTSVYCLLVLRTIREDASGSFVPHVSVGVGVLGGLLSLFALIYFLHDTASTIQARTVVRFVHADLRDAIDRLFPEPLGEGGSAEASEKVELAPESAESARITDVGLGYLQAVDGESLLAIAVEKDLVIRIQVEPGTFVTPETCVALLADVDDATCEAVARCFLLGSRRTPRQDVVCAVDELVEVAVRALSPGVNDPFTAITCVDYLGASLRQLAGRGIPSPNRVDDSGTVRVVVPSISFPRVLAAAVEPLVHHATGTPSVLLRLCRVLAAVAEDVVRDEDAEALRSQSVWMHELAERRLDDRRTIERIGESLREVEKRLDGAGDAARPATE